MYHIKFVIPFLFSSLFFDEKAKVGRLISMIYAQGGVLDRGLGGEG